MTTSPVRTNLFDVIGGTAAIDAATDMLYGRLLADPTVAHHFDGVDLHRLKTHMRAFLAAALGGAALYHGRDMRTAHAGLRITAADWDATVGHLVATLRTLGVSDALIDEIGARVLPLRDEIVTAG